jgi:hypothetical protein
MIAFLLAYGRVTNALSRSIGMRFLPGCRGNQSAVGLALQSILQYHSSGDFLARDVQLNRMALLAKNLAEIGDFSKSLLGHYRKLIKNSRNTDDFFGTRFEINTAATLIRLRLRFEKAESPDFIVLTEFGKAGIECTSARIRKEKHDQSLLYKIESALRDKSKKEYSGPDTALFVDITNLVYRTLHSGAGLHDLLDREALAGVVRQFDFGNLTLFTYLSDRERGGIESAYARIDHFRMGRALASLLDVCLPHGRLPLHEFAVPEEG